MFHFYVMNGIGDYIYYGNPSFKTNFTLLYNILQDTSHKRQVLLRFAICTAFFAAHAKGNNGKIFFKYIMSELLKKENHLKMSKFKGVSDTKAHKE